MIFLSQYWRVLIFIFYVVGVYRYWIMGYQDETINKIYSHAARFITALVWPVMFVVIIVYVIRDGLTEEAPKL